MESAAMNTHSHHPRDPWFHARLLGAGLTALIAMGSAAIRGTDEPTIVAQATNRATVATAAPAQSPPALQMPGAGERSGQVRP